LQRIHKRLTGNQFISQIEIDGVAEEAVLASRSVGLLYRPTT
jgi:hypothetical protein